MVYVQNQNKNKIVKKQNQKTMNIKHNRRKFLKTTVTGMAGFTLLPRCAAELGEWRFLTDEEAKVIIAMCEQIIPVDKDPGATDANVINFIDKQLVTHYKTHQEEYRTGIKGVQETSNAMFKNKFENLDWEEQYQVMLELESGKAKGEKWKNNSSSGFFNMVRNHTVQGFYGSPRHGGNKNYVSYRMLELDYPQIIGQNRY